MQHYGKEHNLTCVLKNKRLRNVLYLLLKGSNCNTINIWQNSPKIIEIFFYHYYSVLNTIHFSNNLFLFLQDDGCRNAFWYWLIWEGYEILPFILANTWYWYLRIPIMLPTFSNRCKVWSILSVLICCLGRQLKLAQDHWLF